MAHGKFQFTPLREGRPVLPGELAGYPAISIHAPPRGATWRGAPGIARENFNSRPSARGDRYVMVSQWVENISIHAPPRGATSCRFRPSIHALFQFTPLREGRRGVLARQGVHTPHFNSRPSARGDLQAAGGNGKENCISIHAPPRGATRHDAHRRGLVGFQFTPLREGRR